MSARERKGDVPTRVLGRTGLEVSIIGVGGYHIGVPSDREVGIRIIRAALDEGVNFLDNAWCYHDGESERIMGRALRSGYRDRAILMTKNHGRDAETFRRQLDDSLGRLQTDRIDVLQFHEIIHEGEPARIASEGAIEAAVAAREAGKIRFIGFTGHRWPRLLREMLDHDFAWDTVQMPVNLLDAHYRSFTKDILPLLSKRSIGVIGMKSLAGGNLLKSPISPQEAICYSLSLPVHTLVCGMPSMAVLDQNLAIGRSWRPLSDEKREQLLERAAPWAEAGELERYKAQ
jgi:predicted aldo/keto reductase-like oxidoreductase